MITPTIFDKWFTPIFGPNWRTTLSGFLAFIMFAASFIVSDKTGFMALGFIPMGAKTFTVSLCEFIAWINVLSFAYHARSASSAPTHLASSSHTWKAEPRLTMLSYHRDTGKNRSAGLLIVQVLILLVLLWVAFELSFCY